MPVSEAEKRGVSALPCHFSKKAEHVPIKKRRFLFRSPPPPAEDTAVATESQDAFNTASDVNSSQIVDGNDSMCVKKCDKPNGKYGQDENLSGISILAAAACSSSSVRECCYVENGSGVEDSSVLQGPREASANPVSSSKGLSKEDFFSSSEVFTEGTLSRISTEQVGDLASMLTAVPCFEEVKGIGQDIKSANLWPDSITSSGNTSCCKVEEMVGNQRPSSRDGRLHWDLNVLMDAWEEPLKDSDVHNGMLGRGNHDNKHLQDHDLQEKLTSACTEQTSLMSDEQKTMADQASSCRTTMNLDIGLHVNVAQLASLGEQSAVSNTFSNQDVSNCNGPDHTNNASVKNFISDTHLCSSRVGVLSVESEDYVASSSDILRESERKVAVSENIEVGVSDRKVIPHSIMSHDASNIVSAASDVRIIQGGNLVGYNATMLNISEDPPVTRKESHGSHFRGTKVLNVPDRNDCAKTAEGEDDLGVQGDIKAMAGTDEAAELQEGYNSQYEDGELRESNECAWEEYEDGYGEVEDVDYGSDNIELSVANPSDHHNPESGEVQGKKIARLGVDAVASSADCIIANDVKQDSRAFEDDIVHDIEVSPDCRVEEKMKLPTGEELQDCSKNSSDMAAGLVTDNNARTDNMHADADGLVDTKDTETREEPKAFRRPLQSRIEAPGVSRDERLHRIDTRFESRSMRSFDRRRYSFQNQTRGQPGGNWDGSLDNRRCRRHYSPINFQRSKLEDGSEERNEVGCGGNQDDISYSHQLLANNRPGVDEVPCSGLQLRYRHDRKVSPDRAAGYGRGRPFRYGPSMGSGRGRGRYNGPSRDESFQSLLKHRRPLSRRERSLSPFGRRGQSNIDNHPGKSPSQPRSRSPVRWNSPRGRPGSGANGSNRHRSRSPTFRSEFRMQRLRSPNQQPGLGGNHVAGFRSTTRAHGSPHNRWNSGRRDEMGQFREFGNKQRTTTFERPPGRIRLRGDRNSVIDSPRNLKPEGYYRVSDRISEDGAGRGLRYEENYEDRRKPFLRPVRSSYEDGLAGKLHHDHDDSFPSAGNMRDRNASSFRGRGGFRSIDSRMGESRRFRGE